MMHTKAEIEVKELIVSFVSELKWATYPQVLRHLIANGVDVAGNVEIRGKVKQNEKDASAILWFGLSDVVANAIKEAILEGKIKALPIPSVTYTVSEPEIMEGIPYPVVNDLSEVNKDDVFYSSCLVDGRVSVEA